MKKLLSFAIAALLMTGAAAPLTSCDSDDSPEATISGTGISDPSTTNTIVVPFEGDEVVFTFNAAANWTATTSDSWVTLLTTSGKKGASTLRVKVPAATDKTNRLASIMINVAGYKSKHIVKIRQGEGENVGEFSQINQVVYDYMLANYLWNEPISELKLNGTANYQTFFKSILDGVDSYDHLNHDDGHWENGVRDDYYSYITRNASGRSRAFGETETGSGILYCTAGFVDNAKTTVALIPLIVSPESSAYKAGIHRGSLITSVGGTKVTASNLNTLYSSLLKGNCTVETVEFVYNEQGQVTGLTSPTSVTVSSTTYEDPAIYASKVITTDSGKKVAYLCYMYFDKDYDTQLLDIFNQFKQHGVDELILDLRYNGGGHVISSTVLATLIAGNNYKDQVYNHVTYNASRTAKGQEDFYRIGNKSVPEEFKVYNPIEQALSYSIGLKTIYVLTTVDTASSSELIINGLRGLDIDVRLIGMTTNGKNVGMESRTTAPIDGYTYTITPITFYSQNAKDFRDYS
ncbi:MAG: hypothetical protein K2F75_05700, partial [Paramuribaculum sp.]|nr:hypothetical protein [Paramuribaculum sp.]